MDIKAKQRQAWRELQEREVTSAARASAARTSAARASAARALAARVAPTKVKSLPEERTRAPQVPRVHGIPKSLMVEMSRMMAPNMSRAPVSAQAEDEDEEEDEDLDEFFTPTEDFSPVLSKSPVLFSPNKKDRHRIKPGPSASVKNHMGGKWSQGKPPVMGFNQWVDTRAVLQKDVDARAVSQKDIDDGTVSQRDVDSSDELSHASHGFNTKLANIRGKVAECDRGLDLELQKWDLLVRENDMLNESISRKRSMDTERWN